MVAARAAGKDQLLEMGGNGPLVVLDDADLDAAVTRRSSAAFLNAGQSCTAGERILVQAGVHDDYLGWPDRGHPRPDPAGRPDGWRDDHGPAQQRGWRRQDGCAMSRDAVARGARLIAGGHRAPQHGSPNFYEATVLDDVDEGCWWPARRPSGRSCR